jgi:coenzyme F420-reducing hydrogenase delta subunit/ferredoxin
MLLTVLHLLREGARGHFLGVRWFSWLSGVPLLWLLWLAGITGLWLLWDDRALYSITATAEWLQALPFFSDTLARNFLTPDALNDRFFSLLVFMHIGVPLLLLGGVWIHLQRISTARIWPPRALTVASLVMLSLLALVVPAESLGPADTGHAVATLSLDWFYLFIHPLVETFSAPAVWLLAGAFTLVLALMPLWPVRAKVSTTGVPAQVDLSNCNGCSRCAADCPFSAIIMVPRTDGRHHQRQASVIADMCAACGICVGACPSSTPFRHIEDIVSGIEMPDMPVMMLRQQLQKQLAVLSDSPRIVLFACQQAVDTGQFSDAATAVLPLKCAAMLPPSFTEYAVRLGAHGVVIAGCREGDCEFRLGDRWVQERFTGAREPRLRAAAPRDRIAVVWAGSDGAQIRHVISALRTRLKSIPMAETPAPESLYDAHHD